MVYIKHFSDLWVKHLSLSEENIKKRDYILLGLRWSFIFRHRCDTDFIGWTETLTM